MANMGVLAVCAHEGACAPGTSVCVWRSDASVAHSDVVVSSCFSQAAWARCEVAPRRAAHVYTWPGSNWRPSACKADVIATRPQVRMWVANLGVLTVCAHQCTCDPGASACVLAGGVCCPPCYCAG